MKKTFILAILTISTLVGFSQTNQISTNAAPTVDSLLIDILSGVRVAGSEVYATSKDVIRKSVDVVSEQAPDVVNQFLTWKMIEASIPIFIAFIILVAAFCVGRKCTKAYAKNPGTHNPLDVIGYFLYFVGLAAFIPVLSCKLAIILKIAVAPKVYLIEYAVSMFSGK